MGISMLAKATCLHPNQFLGGFKESLPVPNVSVATACGSSGIPRFDLSVARKQARLHRQSLRTLVISTVFEVVVRDNKRMPRIARVTSADHVFMCRVASFISSRKRLYRPR